MLWRGCKQVFFYILRKICIKAIPGLISLFLVIAAAT